MTTNTTLEFILNKFGINYDDKTSMPIELPGFGRYDLAYMFKELGFNIGAEIGVYQGEYSEVLCKANPQAKLFSIDPWEPHDEYTAFIKSKTFEKAYEMAKARLSGRNCEMIKKKSLDAVKDFADESLDFVYIDGDHSFQACTNDIVEWSKKVRMGGIVAGHDYIKHLPRSIIHVYEVVNGYTQAYRIRPWFITASKVVINGVITPEERTFFWVKTPFPEPRRYD
ncbi:class I SAM-dependent methyltransferase [candidate division WWE3 bacterium]|jgi:predicted O-methyltransferase YrrM|uniref:Class I SAM-dependent methyltransferase n=1 Tax=candidate division WWE3 bacterium TaxID=2053526 RepID=A0A3A4ZCI6_UNCKA|nr:MAG: class I SAM-dependent methyltransferase [candidate division WWE3 bacterium]